LSVCMDRLRDVYV